MSTTTTTTTVKEETTAGTTTVAAAADDSGLDERSFRFRTDAHADDGGGSGGGGDGEDSTRTKRAAPDAPSEPADADADAAAKKKAKTTSGSGSNKKKNGDLNDPRGFDAVLDRLTQRIRERSGRSRLMLDQRHRAALREIGERADVGEMWATVDFIFETTTGAEWSNIRDETRFIQSLLRKRVDAAAVLPRSEFGVRRRVTPFVHQCLVDEFGPDAVAEHILPPDSSAEDKDRDKDDRSEASSASASLLVDPWGEPGERVLRAIERRISEVSGRNIRFDSRHRLTFRTAYADSTRTFYATLDALFRRMLALEWETVQNETGLIQSIIAQTRPGPYNAASASWVDRDYSDDLLDTIRTMAAPPPSASSSRRYPSSSPSSSSSLTSRPSYAVPPPLPSQPPRRTMGLSYDLESIYTWSLAEQVMDQLGTHISGMLGRRVVFDGMHRDTLRTKYHEDPLGFWSILDQIQDKMIKSDWSLVRNEAKFIQSWIGHFGPSDASLSNFMASLLPPHPSVPHGVPPHVVARRLAPMPIPRMPPPPVSSRPAGLGPMIPWESMFTALQAVEDNASRILGFRVVFDEKHQESLRERYAVDPTGFLSVLDQIHELLIRADWSTIRDKSRFIQSLIHRNDIYPSGRLSPFMQSIIYGQPGMIQSQIQPLPQPQPSPYVSAMMAQPQPQPPPPLPTAAAPVSQFLYYQPQQLHQQPVQPTFQQPGYIQPYASIPL
jgi:hypothetical protein